MKRFVFSMLCALVVVTAAQAYDEKKSAVSSALKHLAEGCTAIDGDKPSQCFKIADQFTASAVAAQYDANDPEKFETYLLQSIPKLCGSAFSGFSNMFSTKEVQSNKALDCFDKASEALIAPSASWNSWDMLRNYTDRCRSEFSILTVPQDRQDQIPGLTFDCFKKAYAQTDHELQTIEKYHKTFSDFFKDKINSITGKSLYDSFRREGVQKLEDMVRSACDLMIVDTYLQRMPDDKMATTCYAKAKDYIIVHKPFPEDLKGLKDFQIGLALNLCTVPESRYGVKWPLMRESCFQNLESPAFPKDDPKNPGVPDGFREFCKMNVSTQVTEADAFCIEHWFNIRKEAVAKEPPDPNEAEYKSLEDSSYQPGPAVK